MYIMKSQSKKHISKTIFKKMPTTFFLHESSIFYLNKLIKCTLDQTDPTQPDSGFRNPGSTHLSVIFDLIERNKLCYRIIGQMHHFTRHIRTLSDMSKIETKITLKNVFKIGMWCIWDVSKFHQIFKKIVLWNRVKIEYS